MDDIAWGASSQKGREGRFKPCFLFFENLWAGAEDFLAAMMSSRERFKRSAMLHNTIPGIYPEKYREIQENRRISQEHIDCRHSCSWRMAGMIVTSKTLKAMGSKINETQGSQVSSFARRQMEKYGWTE
jgi:hypothetical protein